MGKPIRVPLASTVLATGDWTPQPDITVAELAEATVLLHLAPMAILLLLQTGDSRRRRGRGSRGERESNLQNESQLV